MIILLRKTVADLSMKKAVKIIIDRAEKEFDEKYKMGIDKQIVFSRINYAFYNNENQIDLYFIGKNHYSVFTVTFPYGRVKLDCRPIPF